MIATFELQKQAVSFSVKVSDTIPVDQKWTARMHLVLRTEPFICRTWQPHMPIVNSLFLQIALFQHRVVVPNRQKIWFYKYRPYSWTQKQRIKILNHRERDGYWSSIVLVSLVCLCDYVFSSKHHFTFRYVPFFLSFNDKTLSLFLSHIAIYQPKIQVMHPFMIKFTFLSLSMERKRTHL